MFNVYLGVTRPVNGEPDQLPVHREAISSLSSGCTCQSKSRRGFGLSSPCRPIKTEAEEELDRAGPDNKSVATVLRSKIHGSKKSSRSLSPVTGPRGAARRRDDRAEVAES
ncbi:hypothetical protein DPMN_020280 [Dreissena polymorpha]|uniref:Uncharacterized protein n=1 Tax=Dreissena polymorpha TaxID=45954 RepID=A0A9D4NGI4_DREPO|nr:hypothetical protein DPMN_020280 [Dreissena polymorpha]